MARYASWVSERLRNLPVELTVSPPPGFEVWQLEGSVDGLRWETINAGHRETPVRGRFYADQTLYRVLWASHVGSTASSTIMPIPGTHGALVPVGPTTGARRLPGRDF